MSDNDLIRRGVIKERMIARGWKHPDSTVTEFVEDDLPAVPQEMTAREFAIQYDRMCESIRCYNCPMNSSINGTCRSCDYWMSTHMSKAVSIVEAWAREHPEEEEE